MRYAPFRFTEQGVAMLSSVINSRTAIEVNIQIIRVFTKLRQPLIDTLSLKLEIEKIKKKPSYQNNNIDFIVTCLDELVRKKENAEPR